METTSTAKSGSIPSSPAPAPAAKAPANSTPPTRAQRDALFTQAAKGMTPANANHKPEDPLRVWRSQILKSYKKGYTVEQIMQILASPAINVKTSIRSLHRFVRSEIQAAAAKPAGK